MNTSTFEQLIHDKEAAWYRFLNDPTEEHVAEYIALREQYRDVVTTAQSTDYSMVLMALLNRD